MKNITLFFSNKLVTYLVSALLLISCDRDVSDIGSSILTGTIIDTSEANFSVDVQEISLNSVQTNNLSLNYLGKNTNQLGATSNYSILSKVSPAAIDFGITSVTGPLTEIEFVSLKLILPYPYKAVGTTNINGDTIYKIDENLTNNNNLKIDVLSPDFTVRLNGLDANKPQPYYSNAVDGINSTPFLTQINSPDTRTLVSDFQIPIISNTITVNSGTSIDEETDILKRTVPSIEIVLDSDDQLNLKEIIKNLTDETFFNNSINDKNSFVSLIRSIYLQPTADNEGAIGIFTNPGTQDRNPQLQIALSIRRENDITNQEIAANFNLNRQLINLINSDSPATSSPKSITIAGGVGSIAEISLFESDELAAFFDSDSPQENAIINNAEIIFTVDNSKNPSITIEELPKLFLYPIENPTSSNNNQVINRSPTSINIAATKEDGNFIYTINITSYIENLLSQSTNLQSAINRNLKLGLGLSNSSNSTTTFSEILNSDAIRFANSSTVSGIETVKLFNGLSNEGQRPKLKIKYTSTKQ